LINGWKRFDEVQARKKAAEATTLAGKAAAFGAGGLISGEKELSFQKTEKGGSVLSNKVQIELLQARDNFTSEKGRAPNAQEQSELNSQVALKNNLGAAFVDKVAQDLVKVAEPAKEQRKRILEERKFDNKALADVVKNVDKGADVISSIQVFDKAVGGMFTNNFENVASKDLIDGIKNRTMIGETNDTIFTLMLNKVLGIDETSKTRQDLQNKLDEDKEFQKLVKSPQFNSVFIPLATMLNTVLADRSGAAVTENEFARLKSEFGIDIFGSPDSFIQGVRGFSTRFKDKQVNFLNTLDDKQLSLFDSRLKKRGGIDPRALPSEIDVEALKSELDALNAKEAE